MEYIYHILIMISLYVMLSQSLSITAGYSNMISLAHAGFYGIGAYTSAILSTTYGWSFLATLPLAIIFCGLLGALISTIALRTVDDYFIIITLGIQVIVFSIMNNWQSLTNGPLGIVGIPSISIFNFTIDSNLSFLILSFVFTFIVFYLLRNVSKSSFGLMLRAISDDEIFAKSLGKNVYKAKISSFVIGAMFAAIPGVLYAHYVSYIDPTSFTVDESIFILSIIIIGGMRNLWGCVLASIFLVTLPELLRFVGLPNGIAANLNQMIYGVLLVVVVARNGFTQYKTRKRIS